MIRADMGRVEAKGDMPMLLAELTCICNTLKKGIMEDGLSEEKAKEHIQECLDMAFMSEKEIDEKTRRAMINILLKGLV